MTWPCSCRTPVRAGCASTSPSTRGGSPRSPSWSARRCGSALVMLPRLVLRPGPAQPRHGDRRAARPSTTCGCRSAATSARRRGSCTGCSSARRPWAGALTVVLRLALQAAATYLLLAAARRARRARGAGPAPSWRCTRSARCSCPPPRCSATGIGLSIAQTAVLGAMVAHVRYTRRGRLADALVAAALVLLASCSPTRSSSSSCCCRRCRSASCTRDRCGRGCARRRVAGPAGRPSPPPPACSPFFYLSGSYTGAPERLRPRRRPGTSPRHEWSDVLGPALLGGPWRWLYRPRRVGRVRRPAAGARRPRPARARGAGRAGRAAHGPPRPARAGPAGASPTLGGALLVGYGRYDFLGTWSRRSCATATTPPVTAGDRRGARLLPHPGGGGRPRRRRARPTTGRRRSTRAATGPPPSPWPACSPRSSRAPASPGTSGPTRPRRTSHAHRLRPRARARASSCSTRPCPTGWCPGCRRTTSCRTCSASPGCPAVFGGSAPLPRPGRRGRPVVPSTFFPVADALPTRDPSCGTFLEGAGSTTVPLAPGRPRRRPGTCSCSCTSRTRTRSRLEVRDADGSPAERRRRLADRADHRGSWSPSTGASASACPPPSP